MMEKTGLQMYFKRAQLILIWIPANLPFHIGDS